MIRAFRPSPERLEAHVVLSSAATAIVASAASPIVETLTTDQTVYKVGQPISHHADRNKHDECRGHFSERDGPRGFYRESELQKRLGVERLKTGRTFLHLATRPDAHNHRHLERPRQRRPERG